MSDVVDTLEHGVGTAIPTPVKPGRGAWSQAGGLLPPKPGQTGHGYFYRPPYPNMGEAMVGSAYLSGREKTYNAYVVTEAVKALQRLVNVTPDGLLGDQTGAAIVAFQRAHGLVPDAIVGPKTMLTLLTPIITAAATKYSVPLDALGGIGIWESQLDLGAVGVETPYDTGPVQINTAASAARGFSIAEVVDPAFAFDFAARDMAAFAKKWQGDTKASLRDLLIAQHNSPKSATEWAISGVAPNSQIANYVLKVGRAWSNR